MKALKPLAVQLDTQASDVVRAYARLTDSEPADVVNGAVTDTTANAVEMLQPGPRYRDDSVGIVAAHVAAAVRRRTGEDAPDAEVKLSPLPADHAGPMVDPAPPATATHTVTLEFNPEAHAHLALVAAYDEVSVEELIRTSLAGTVTAWHERGMRPQQREQEVRAAFGLPKQE